jgi:hypothetical protein
LPSNKSFKPNSNRYAITVGLILVLGAMGKFYHGPLKFRRLPKSFVIGWAAGLTALLVAGPFAAIGKAYELPLLFKAGFVLFLLCWLACALCIAFFGGNFLSGAYRDIQEKSWRDQVW